jgi:HEAT repeat protein
MLDGRQIHAIAVGKHAFRYKEFGLSTGEEGARGPVEQALIWVKESDDFLVLQETVEQVVQLLNTVGAAKRPDIGCRILKRYVKLLEHGKQDQRLAAAKAITESMLRCSPFMRKVVTATAQDAVTNLLQSESEGPVLEILTPLSFGILAELIGKGQWDAVLRQMETLRKRSSGAALVQQALDVLEHEQKLDPVFHAFETPETRLAVEPIISMLGSHSVRTLAKIVQKGEDGKTRSAAAVLLRKCDPQGWTHVLRGMTSVSPARECLNVLEALPLLMEDMSGAGNVLVRLADHADEGVVSRLIEMADLLGSSAAGEIVMKLLWRPDEGTILKAIHAATHLKLKEPAVPILNVLRREAGEKVSIVCCEYFRAVPAPVAMEQLTKIVTFKSGLFGMKHEYGTNLRAAAILALGAYSKSEARQIVQSQLEDKSPAIRAAARWVLDHTKGD